MYLVQDTLDDLLQGVYKGLLRSKDRVSPRKGANREAVGALLKLRNPRARFSRTEQRATLHSCLGETLWYFSGSKRLDFVEYYIPSYRKFSKLSEEEVFAEGAYGPRLFGGDNCSVDKIVDLLNTPDRHDTRQAVIQIYSNDDMGKNDVPCTCTIQFLARGKKLNVFVSMRSNDAYLGLPHDIFAFTMLQEYVARCTGHELGFYNHAVGSLHLYDRHESAARQYVAAGWQDKLAMPSMPTGDPREAFRWLLEVEQSIREGALQINDADNVDPYWVDLARLLLIKRFFDLKDLKSIVRQKMQMSSPVYNAFIRGRELEISKESIDQPLLPGIVNSKARPNA